MVAFVSISPFAFADGGWSLNSDASYARLYQGSKANPDSVNTGVARVTGKLKLNSTDLADSIFELSIYPADEDWGGALNPEGQLRSGYVPEPTDHTLLRFKSKSIRWAEGGELRIIGDLTLARVVRPSESPSGFVQNGIIGTTTAEIEFRFPHLTAALSAEPSNRQEKGALEISGTANVDHDAFPKLLNAITETNWPPVVRNKVCTMPLVIGRDYSGAQCTGDLLAATRNDNCSMPESAGADYSGPVCTLAAGNQTTIVVHLKLLSTGSKP
jgi:hypothetical protein